MKLLSDAQLNAIQNVAMRGMQTDVTIMRQTTNLGLETADGPYGSEPSVPAAAASGNVTVKGMLHSIANDLMSLDAGQLVAVHEHRLWVPVGTDIRNGDRVSINGKQYVVNDVANDETWPAFLGVMIVTAE